MVRWRSAVCCGCGPQDSLGHPLPARHPFRMGARPHRAFLRSPAPLCKQTPRLSSSTHGKALCGLKLHSLAPGIPLKARCSPSCDHPLPSGRSNPCAACTTWFPLRCFWVHERRRTPRMSQVPQASPGQTPARPGLDCGCGPALQASGICLGGSVSAGASLHHDHGKRTGTESRPASRTRRLIILQHLLRGLTS